MSDILTRPAVGIVKEEAPEVLDALLKSPGLALIAAVHMEPKAAAAPPTGEGAVNPNPMKH